MTTDDHDHDCQLSDDERAEEAWARAAVTGFTKDVGRFAGPLLVGLCLLAVSWPLTFLAAITLGGAAIAALVVTCAVTLFHMVIAARKLHRKTPAPDLKPWPSRIGWAWWAASAIPRGAATAYTLTWWTHPAVAVAGGLLVAVWPLVTHRLLATRFGGGGSNYWQRWQDLVAARRPLGGLPTPEI